MRRDDRRLDAEIAAETGRERRSGTAADNKDGVARIVTALDGHQLEGIDHARMGNIDDRQCCILDAQPQRPSHSRDRFVRLPFVQMHAAAGKCCGIEDAYGEDGIGQCRLRAAAPVAGWTRCRAGTLRTHD